jgi:hypothetical protein
MRSLLLIPFAILLSGCLATAPRFPEAPPELTSKCPELNEVAPGTKEFSKVLDVVVVNYSTYYECRVKVEAWQEWHKSQKEIYNNAVK